MAFGSFLAGVAKAGSEDIEKRRSNALEIKLESEKVRMAAEEAKRKFEYERFGPEASRSLGALGGYATQAGEQFSTPQAALFAAQGRAQTAADAKDARGRPTLSGEQIMTMLPDGSSLGLDPLKQYPYSMATFATNATRMGMGTADMKNTLVGIEAFDKGVKGLKAKYDSFAPGNPLINTAQEKWSSLTKGWTLNADKANDEEGSALESGLADKFKQEALASADNAEVGDMLATKISLAMEFARATNGARPSDRDFLNALKVIPDYSSDPKLRELRFSHLAEASDNKREAIFRQAPKLRQAPKEEPKSNYSGLSAKEALGLMVKRFEEKEKAKAEAAKAAQKAR